MSSAPTPPNLPPMPPPVDPSRPGTAANDPRWQQTPYTAAATKAQQKAYRQQQRDAVRAQARQQKEVLRAARRSNRAPSILGPLLLIVVAVVALLLHSGRVSFAGAIAWYSRWWPVLLIAFGLLRLGEWALDRAMRRPDQPPVRYALGGGVVSLIFFMVVFGIALQSGAHISDGNNWQLGFSGDNWKQFLGSKHEQDTPAATHAIAATGALVIDDPRGDVTVAGTSDDGLLHLSTHKEVFTSSDSDARDRLAALEPQFSGTPDALVLRVNGRTNDDADLSILVPATVRVSVNANRGDVKVSNFKAAASVTANRGDVDVAAITGPVSIRVNSRNKSVLAHSIEGQVDVQGTGDEINLTEIDGNVRVAGDFFGGGHLQHITGPVTYNTSRITFDLASLEGETSFDDHDEFSVRDAAGPFTLRTRSRDLELTRISGNINVSNNHGKVELTAIPPGGSITVDNHDGDIRLNLPVQARFTLAAETSDGDVSSNFSVVGGNTAHGTLNGTIAGGGNAVRLTTTHGDIAVSHNGDVTPAAPRAPRTPMKLGFGSVPAPPTPPGALPQEATSALAAAQQQIQQAQQQALLGVHQGTQLSEESRREALRAAQEGLREAQQQIAEARREGLQQAAEARRDAQRQAEEARQQVDQARRESQHQAEEARQQADQARREAQREAEQARRDAQRQADQARREAQRQIEEARKQAHQND